MKDRTLCLLAGGLLFLSITARAEPLPRSFEQAFLFSFIDREFEKEAGGPPFDRSLYARAIDRCHELGAKGVVVKLFLDQDRPGEGDDILAKAMRAIPVVLQARIEPQTGLPNDLPERFVFSPEDLKTAIAGDRGWMPLPKLAAAAADVGFVDFADEQVPLLESYRGKTYKSVIVCALELMSGEKAKIDASGRLVLGHRPFPSDRNHVQKVVRSNTPLPTCAFADLLGGKVDPTQIKDRVVIIGYTGRTAPVIPTASGNIDAHVFFGQCLRAVFESINH